jgi:hypothetical protein
VIASSWQSTDVAKTIQYDPFALPSLFPQRIQEAKEKQLAHESEATDHSESDATARAESLKQLKTQFGELQRQGVRIVMEQNEKYVAVIGEKTIHVGDDIDGFTVVAIDAQGVRVSRELKQ